MVSTWATGQVKPDCFSRNLSMFFLGHAISLHPQREKHQQREHTLTAIVRITFYYYIGNVAPIDGKGKSPFSCMKSPDAKSKAGTNDTTRQHHSDNNP